MVEVLVPRDNVNDDTMVVVSVTALSGARVQRGGMVVELETSKNNIEVTAPAEGVVHHQLQAGMEVRVGELLFKLEDEGKSPTASTGPAATAPAAGTPARLSRAALARAMELGVDPGSFGAGMVNVADVERKAGLAPAAPSKVGKRIVVYGGGGHAKMCIDLLKGLACYDIVGVVDAGKAPGSLVCGVPVLGGDECLTRLREQGLTCAVNGVGGISDPELRAKIFAKLTALGFELPNLVHPSALVEPSCLLGQGNQVMMGACVGSDVRIGDNCIINSGAIVSHDSLIDDHAHVAPGAVLAGGVHIGELAVVGLGATVHMKVRIGARAVVFNGANVFRNVVANDVFRGV